MDDQPKLTPQELDRQVREFDDAWQQMTGKPQPAPITVYYHNPKVETWEDALEYMETGQRYKLN